MPTDWTTSIIVSIYKDRGDNRNAKSIEKYHYFVEDVRY
jgi:hypothetical protein